MRRSRVVGLAATLALGVIAVQPVGADAAKTVTPKHALAPVTADPADGAAKFTDNLPNPLESKRNALKQEALQEVVAGKLKPQKRGDSVVAQVSTPSATASGKTKSKYVELSRETTDRVFVVLAEFGNKRSADYPDQDTDPNTPGPATFNGPLHNKIPEPDRSKDNSTNWKPDYDKKHFEDIYFKTGKGAESLASYYDKQSSGRFTVSGKVTDWVKVPYNEARYGRSNGYPCAGNVCSNTWALIKDAVNVWVKNQLASGMSLSAVKKELKTFDRWDRYDYDGDGNFNEPDGYIDHFQIVHAGGDQADGDPWQGEDAIWSHRWYAYTDGIGSSGPSNNELGGTQIGKTGMWIGDYTIQPENGGRSVFFHEFGHDLGLPDLYDTNSGGSTPMEYWSLMAQSRLGGKGAQSIGNRAGDLDAWSKMQLGWWDYDVIKGGTNRTLNIGPHEYQSDLPQGLVVTLPDKEVTTDLGDPHAGDGQWWSGGGDDLDNTMSRTLTVPKGTTTLKFWARWNIEDCGSDACDYAYVMVDDGSGFEPIAGNITSASEGDGIDGLQEDWTQASFDLSAYAGKKITLAFEYRTDGAVQGTEPSLTSGLFVDDLAITNGSNEVLTDDAETSPNGWTLDGFTQVGSSTTDSFRRYYLAAWRTRVSYDQYLQYGPYNFGFADRPDWVEHFPYQQGLVIEQWDTSQADNNVSIHPGQGQNLTIDAHPQAITRLDGDPWRARIQLYDAPFNTSKADSFTLHYLGEPSYIRGKAGAPTFNDTKNYYDPLVPDHGVKVAKAGVKIRVLKDNGTSARIQVMGS